MEILFVSMTLGIFHVAVCGLSCQEGTVINEDREDLEEAETCIKLDCTIRKESVDCECRPCPDGGVKYQVDDSRCAEKDPKDKISGDRLPIIFGSLLGFIVIIVLIAGVTITLKKRCRGTYENTANCTQPDEETRL